MITPPKKKYQPRQEQLSISAPFFNILCVAIRRIAATTPAKG